MSRFRISLASGFPSLHLRSHRSGFCLGHILPVCSRSKPALVTTAATHFVPYESNTRLPLNECFGTIHIQTAHIIHSTSAFNHLAERAPPCVTPVAIINMVIIAVDHAKCTLCCQWQIHFCFAFCLSISYNIYARCYLHPSTPAQAPTPGVFIHERIL